MTRADQAMIDENAEAGIAACKWQRPLPKTPTCEEIRAEIAALRAKAGQAAPLPRPAPKKGIIRRIRDKVHL